MIQQQVTDHAANTALGVAAASAVAGTLLHEVSVVLQILAYIASITSAVLAGIYHYKKIRGK